MYKSQNNHQIIPLMNKLLIAFLFCILSTNLFSKESNNYFKRGKDHYNKKKSHWFLYFLIDASARIKFGSKKVLDSLAFLKDL